MQGNFMWFTVLREKISFTFAWYMKQSYANKLFKDTYMLYYITIIITIF